MAEGELEKIKEVSVDKLFEQLCNPDLTESVNQIQVHVVYRQEGWALVERGASRAIRVFKSKMAALRAANSMRESGYDVVIHGRSGAVQKWESAV